MVFYTADLVHTVFSTAEIFRTLFLTAEIFPHWSLPPRKFSTWCFTTRRFSVFFSAVSAFQGDLCKSVFFLSVQAGSLVIESSQTGLLLGSPPSGSGVWGGWCLSPPTRPRHPPRSLRVALVVVRTIIRVVLTTQLDFGSYWFPVGHGGSHWCWSWGPWLPGFHLGVRPPYPPGYGEGQY